MKSPSAVEAVPDPLRVGEPAAQVDAAFSASFLDDYYAESDEHLGAVRAALLALEASVDAAGPPSQSLIEELFRSFHSLKGISGMVGLRPAELLAHEMESYLRVLKQGQTQPSASGCDALIAGTRKLEEVIAGHKEGAPPSDITAVMEELARLVQPCTSPPSEPRSAATGSVASEDGTQRIEAARARGLSVWRMTFVPDPALTARGVDIGAVRARLQERGELIRVEPRVRPGGLAFELIWASAASDMPPAQWRDDGLSWEPYPAQSIRQSAAASTDDARTRNPVATDDARAPNPVAAASRPGFIVPAHVVRVDLTRLDELMRITGDLVVQRARLDDRLRRLQRDLPGEEWRKLQESSLALERHLRDLREGVMRARLVPVGEIFGRMPFVVRDLARDSGKKARLELVGEQTEIDKYLVEQLMDPLLHLVRNAMSHGIETVEERVSAGKSKEGRIVLRAASVGESVVIEVQDDGRGIDAERVREQARAAGWSNPDAAANDDSLLDMLCTPGFSTRTEADRASGRGVGMDVVRNAVQALHGSLGLATAAGRGSLFTIRLPLTLAITDALIVSVGSQRFAVPQAAVREVIEVPNERIDTIENNEVTVYRGRALPLLRLARLFGLPEAPRAKLHAFVIGNGRGAMLIGVDRVLGQREIVVRPITDPLVKTPGIAGATELGDGEAVLILDTARLATRTASRAPSATRVELQA